MKRGLGVLAVILSGCGLYSMEPIDLSGCDLQIFPGPCVDEDHPLELLDDGAAFLAEGGVTAVDVLTVPGLAFTLSSRDPEVVEVVAAPDGGFELHGRGVGVTSIAALGSDGSQLDTMAVAVRPIAAVEFRFDPNGADALAELAALPGATELIRVVPLEATGETLVGAEGLIQIEVTGALSAGVLAEAETRLGQVQLFNLPPTVGYQTPVRFDALGSGAITATVEGVPLRTLPVEVIAAATTVALVPGSPTAPVGWVQVAGLVGTDARGVPVAGLIGDFTVSPPELVTLDEPHVGEAQMWLRATGVVTVTATLPDRVIGATFEIVP